MTVGNNNVASVVKKALVTGAISAVTGNVILWRTLFNTGVIVNIWPNQGYELPVSVIVYMCSFGFFILGPAYYLTYTFYGKTTTDKISSMFGLTVIIAITVSLVGFEWFHVTHQ